MIRVEAVTNQHFAALELLFGSDDVADRCWCMWFIRPVKDFHAAGRTGNQEMFRELASAATFPIGLIAFDGGEPVGWCAVGPRDRYTRMLKSPTLQERDRSEDSKAWLVPCFMIRPDRRGSGVATSLLTAAVALAAAHGAAVIEGFPLAGDKRRSGGSDFQTGVEGLFAGCGFYAVYRPSANRVIMRREIG